VVSIGVFLRRVDVISLVMKFVVDFAVFVSVDSRGNEIVPVGIHLAT
jgi:hypothetical protein